MKNIIQIAILLIVTFLFSVQLAAQCDVEESIALDNSGFEDWVDEGNYEDPAGDFWDTANRTVDLAPILYNANVVKDTDAHSGNYSAKLTTSNWFTLVTSATVFSGAFVPNQLDPLESVKFGKPFTERPDYFRVWYKYAPVDGDSAEVYTYLEKWNGTERVRIGEAYTKLYDAQSEWTELLIPFTYNSTEAPDSITLVFASSAAGDNFEGQIGNTLYVDDVEMVKCLVGINSISDSGIEVVTYPNPVNGETLRFEVSQAMEDGLIRVFSNDGKEISSMPFSGKEFSLDVVEWSTALYRFVIFDQKTSKSVASGSFIIE